MESREAGADSPLYHGRVDVDAAAAFALATNDANPRYLNGDAVPPMFTAALVLPSLWASEQHSGDGDRVEGDRGSVHGEQDTFFRGDVRPGTALRWRASTYSARQTKGGALVTKRILVTDDEGAPLVEHFWSNFHIGGSIAAERGPDRPDHTFPEEARARRHGSRTIVVVRDQAYRYAGVSGDRAGHALDDEIARSEGYPSKILQGMCTFSLCSAAMVDLGAGGDVSRLRRLAGRFSAPAFPSKDLVVTAYDAGTTTDGLVALAFEAVQDGVTVIKHGRAELRP